MEESPEPFAFFLVFCHTQGLAPNLIAYLEDEPEFFDAPLPIAIGHGVVIEVTPLIAVPTEEIAGRMVVNLREHVSRHYPGTEVLPLVIASQPAPQPA